MKRPAVCIYIVVALILSSLSASSLEQLSNESLDKISGKAVSDNPAFIGQDIFFPAIQTDQEMSSYSQGTNGVHQTVTIEFIGRDAQDEFGYVYREIFYANAFVENVVYQTENAANGMYSFVVFEGTLKGQTRVPEFFDNNPNVPTKDVTISRARIDLPEGLTGNYLCSYQGHVFSSDEITQTEQTFTIYPNRQTITTGKAVDGSMAILLPRGTGANTLWTPVIKTIDPLTHVTEYLIIPDGERYVHISLNHLVARMDVNFQVRMSNSTRPWTQHDNAHLPPDRNQTLGSFSMTGGNTTINGGNIFITAN
ncbi:MAG: hypothetical protein KKD44_22865 [Proteobacteria bacterium]|nr:hypothetical protein [Pseudomonadota bacterium]